MSSISEVYEFLDFHYLKYQEEFGFFHITTNAIDFIVFVEQSLIDLENNVSGIWVSEVTNERHSKISPLQKKYVQEWIDKRKQELQSEKFGATEQGKKIIWNGSPSLLGYLFTELAKKRFISPPTHAGDISYAGFAKQVLKHFDINTTHDNLIKEFNPEKNTLSDTKRAKFTIPELSDLA